MRRLITVLLATAVLAACAPAQQRPGRMPLRNEPRPNATAPLRTPTGLHSVMGREASALTVDGRLVREGEWKEGLAR